MAAAVVNFVFLYGAPAVGKLTVAQELARLTGYRLFHNHHSIDYARPIFDFGAPGFFALVEDIRVLTAEHAAKRQVNLIHTGVYVHSHGDQFHDRLLDAVEGNGGRVCLVQLLCDPGEQARRLDAPSRLALNKLTRVELPEELRATHDWLTPIPSRPSLTIDTTTLLPEAAARLIADHYGLPVSQPEPDR